MSQDNFLKVGTKIEKTIKHAIKASLNYEHITGRNLGITAEVGEVLAAKLLSLRLAKSKIQKGYDAVDENGKTVQIKTRRSDNGQKPKRNGRVGRFGKHEFNYALLIILSDRYEVMEIYKAEYDKVQPLVSQYERRNPPIRAFIKMALKIYPR